MYKLYLNKNYLERLVDPNPDNLEAEFLKLSEMKITKRLTDGKYVFSIGLYGYVWIMDFTEFKVFASEEDALNNTNEITLEADFKSWYKALDYVDMNQLISEQRETNVLLDRVLGLKIDAYQEDFLAASPQTFTAQYQILDVVLWVNNNKITDAVVNIAPDGLSVSVTLTYPAIAVNVYVTSKTS